jgi:hypothetical protein
MQNNTLLEIQESFVREGINSPLLLSDLASMEKYISESYQGRSLIELLQNADDALATKFYIERIDSSTYLIANNGRFFTNEDLISICRSGASTKQRKSNSIGFRGIGFKSIVNYARRVHILSGKIKITFSKELSQNILNEFGNVPLIRIPHEFVNYEYFSLIDRLETESFKTFFIFEVISDELANEMASFESTSMLFLNNIKEIIFKLNEQTKIYKISREINENYVISSIDSDKSSRWLTINDANNCSVSFLLDTNGCVTRIEKDEAVVHSFLPTKEFTGLPLKLNGDFSTDPSRTKIIIDEDTLFSVDRCIEILTNLVLNIIKQEDDPFLIVDLLSTIERDELSEFKSKQVGDVIFGEFTKTLKKSLQRVNSAKNVDGVCFQPPWIEEKDFSKICTDNNLLGFGISLERKIPGLIKLFKKSGVCELPFLQVIEESQRVEFSVESRQKIFSEIIRKYRFGFDEKIKLLINKSKLLEFENGCKSIDNSEPNEKIQPTFYDAIVNLIDDEKDLFWLLRKLNLYDDSTGTFNVFDKAIMQSNNNPRNDQPSIFVDSDNIVPDKIEESQFVTFTEKPIFQKWRSAEENVALYFENISGVVKVTDVSKSNLGYDLEIQWADKIDFIEVKSVTNLGDSFSMTNNEYSTSVEYGDNYYLGIVEQNLDGLKICFIQNPIKTITLLKRVTRWEWVCNEYSGILINTGQNKL